MQQLDPENVTRVTNVAFHEVKERTHFTHSVLGPYFVSSKNLDGFLPDIEVFCALLDESGNYPGRRQCAVRPSGYTQDLNARNNISVGPLNHSQTPRILSIGTITLCSSSSTSISRNDESSSPASDKSITRPRKTSF